MCESCFLHVVFWIFPGFPLCWCGVRPWPLLFLRHSEGETLLRTQEVVALSTAAPRAAMAKWEGRERAVAATNVLSGSNSDEKKKQKREGEQDAQEKKMSTDVPLDANGRPKKPEASWERWKRNEDDWSEGRPPFGPAYSPTHPTYSPTSPYYSPTAPYYNPMARPCYHPAASKPAALSGATQKPAANEGPPNGRITSKKRTEKPAGEETTKAPKKQKPSGAASKPAAMALTALSDDALRVIFSQLCDVLDPGVAVAFGSASKELWTLTQAQRQQLKADHEAAAATAAALGRKAGKRGCKQLREAKRVESFNKGLSSDELAQLGKLGSVLPALEELYLYQPAASPDGVPRLAEKLGAGALPAVTFLRLGDTPVGDAGASALAAALGRGALPRLKTLILRKTAIGDAGLVALAPALRRLPALEVLDLCGNPFGDEGLAALVAPPPTGGLAKLKGLYLSLTQINDAGCVALAAAFDSGALPALETTSLYRIPASDAAKATVQRPGLRLFAAK